MAKLENWSVVQAFGYDTPEAGKRLSGIVSGHPHFSNGKAVITSRIAYNMDGKLITISGSEYELGEIDPEYERLFPNARERLFNSLGETK